MEKQWGLPGVANPLKTTRWSAFATRNAYLVPIDEEASLHSEWIEQFRQKGV